MARFVGEPATRLVGVEAAGEGLAGKHAAALAGGSPGVLHGSRSYLLQDDDGQVTEAHSISAGLDYPGIGPQLSALYAAGRLEILSATDDEARRRACGCSPGPRASCPRSSPRMRSPRWAPGSRARPASSRSPTTRSCCSASRVAATRTSRRSPTGCDGMTVAARAPLRPRRSRPPARTRIARRLRRRQPATAARRSSRTRWRAIRTRRRSEAIAIAAIDAGADLLEIGLPYSDPLADGATLQRASRVALAAGATLDRSIELVGRIHAARPDDPARDDGLRQPGHGRPRRRVGPRAPRRRPAISGFILADLTPDEGADLERRRSRARHRDRLPRRADDPARASRRGRGAKPRLPLRGLACRRDRCPQRLPPGVGRFLATSAPSARSRSRSGSASRDPPTRATLARSADGVIVASALVDALGPDGRDVSRMAELVRSLAAATTRRSNARGLDPSGLRTASSASRVARDRADDRRCPGRFRPRVPRHRHARRGIAHGTDRRRSRQSRPSRRGLRGAHAAGLRRCHRVEDLRWIAPPSPRVESSAAAPSPGRSRRTRPPASVTMSAPAAWSQTFSR